MDEYKRLYQGQPIGTGAQLLYEVPFDRAAIIMDAEAVNIGTDDNELTLWIVPPGEMPEDEWIWRPSTTVPPAGSLVWEGSKALEYATAIWGEAIGATTNVIITGMEVDVTPVSL